MRRRDESIGRAHGALRLALIVGDAARAHGAAGGEAALEFLRAYRQIPGPHLGAGDREDDQE